VSSPAFVAPTDAPSKAPRAPGRRYLGATLKDHAKLFAASIVFGLVLAVVTGPEGSASAPTSGFTASLSLPRVLWFIGLGLLIYVFRVVASLVGAQVRGKVRGARLRVSSFLSARRIRVVLECALIVVGFAFVQWLAPHDTWKGGLCVQLGVGLLVAEVVVELRRRGHLRTGRLVIWAVLAAYGALAWSTGAVPHRLNHYNVVQHNPVFGRTLMWLAALLAIIEGLAALAEVVGTRVTKQRTRGVLWWVGAVLVVYGWLTWTRWVQWNARTPGSLAHWLSAHRLLVHSSNGGLAVMGVGVGVLVAATVWLLLDLAKGGGTSAPQRKLRRRIATPTMGRPALMLLIMLLALEWPLHMDPASQSNIDTQIMPFVLLALGLNVVIGFAGLLDLGYVAFYAIGAYTTAYFTGALTPQPPFVLDTFWVIPFAIGAAMLAGVLLGTPTLRLRGDYLAIVTLGFGEIIYLFANNNFMNITGGPAGAPGSIPNFSFRFLSPFLKATGDWTSIGYMSFYYLILGVVLLSVFAFSSLEHSKVGRSWAAIREDEVAADSLGVNALKYKVMAFAIGASTGGLAGVFLISQNGTLFPTAFTLQFSITVVVCVVLGGMGSIPGAIVGAVIVLGLPAYLQQHNFSWYQPQDFLLYLGMLLIIMMIFRPQGIVPSRRRMREISQTEAGGRGAGFVDADAQPGWPGMNDSLGAAGPISAETE